MSWFLFQTPCVKRPCQNGGVCTPLYYDDSHMCDCNTGFTGRNCEISRQNNRHFSVLFTGLLFKNFAVLTCNFKDISSSVNLSYFITQGFKAWVKDVF